MFLNPTSPQTQNAQSNSQTPIPSHSFHCSHGQRWKLNQVQTQLQGKAAAGFPKSLRVPRGPFRSASLYKKRRKNKKLKNPVWSNVKLLERFQFGIKTQSQFGRGGFPAPEWPFHCALLPSQNSFLVQEAPRGKGTGRDLSPGALPSHRSASGL